jgi:hypothetical protein
MRSAAKTTPKAAQQAGLDVNRWTSPERGETRRHSRGISPRRLDRSDRFARYRRMSVMGGKPTLLVPRGFRQ